MADYVGWLAGDPPDRQAIEDATARLPAESDDRRAGEVATALARARARYLDGDEDWTESLAAVRPRLGAAAGRVVLRDTGWPIFLLCWVIGLVAALWASAFASGLG